MKEFPQCPLAVEWEITYGHTPDDYTHTCSDHLAKMLGDVYESARQNKMDAPKIGKPQTDRPRELKCCYIERNAEIVALFLRINRLENRIDQLNVQLAGCGVAALGYVKGENDCKHGAFGWSVSLEDVKRLYVKYDQARKALQAITEIAGEDASLLDIRQKSQDGLAPLPEATWG